MYLRLPLNEHQAIRIVDRITEIVRGRYLSVCRAQFGTPGSLVHEVNLIARPWAGSNALVERVAGHDGSFSIRLCTSGNDCFEFNSTFEPMFEIGIGECGTQIVQGCDDFVLVDFQSSDGVLHRFSFKPTGKIEVDLTLYDAHTLRLHFVDKPEELQKIARAEVNPKIEDMIRAFRPNRVIHVPSLNASYYYDDANREIGVGFAHGRMMIHDTLKERAKSYFEGFSSDVIVRDFDYIDPNAVHDNAMGYGAVTDKFNPRNEEGWEEKYYAIDPSELIEWLPVGTVMFDRDSPMITATRATLFGADTRETVPQ